jgi:hypothetical protein
MLNGAMKNIIKQAIVKSGFCKSKQTAHSRNTRNDAHGMFDKFSQASRLEILLSGYS